MLARFPACGGFGMSDGSGRTTADLADAAFGASVQLVLAYNWLNIATMRDGRIGVLTTTGRGCECP